MKQTSQPKTYPKVRNMDFYAVPPHTFCVLEVTVLKPIVFKANAGLFSYVGVNGALTTLSSANVASVKPAENETQTVELSGHARCNPADKADEYSGMKHALAHCVSALDKPARKRIWDYFLRHYPPLDKEAEFESSEPDSHDVNDPNSRFYIPF